jgi:hypothetical protein
MARDARTERQGLGLDASDEQLQSDDLSRSRVPSEIITDDSAIAGGRWWPGEPKCPVGDALCSVTLAAPRCTPQMEYRRVACNLERAEWRNAIAALCPADAIVAGMEAAHVGVSDPCWLHEIETKVILASLAC